MKILVLCSSPAHPVMPRLRAWVDKLGETHDVGLIYEVSDAHGGDILFLISCTEVVEREARARFKKVLVIHASDLPKGRGWSPHIWQILEGRNEIAVTLLEAADSVDSGDIWAKRSFHLEGHELYDEINERLFDTELALMDFAVENFDCITPTPQSAEEPTYYPRRTPKDSAVDPGRSITEQFDLLRTADPDRFPAFFDLRGHTYELVVRKRQ